MRDRNNFLSVGKSKGVDFMKKILSILLVLVFCLGIFVSCDNNEQSESSSESTQESEMTSGGEELSSESEGIQQSVSFDNIGVPILKKGKTEYSYVKAETNNEAEKKYALFDRIVFVEYLDFLGFVNKNIGRNVEIDQNTFEENFIIAIYCSDNYQTKLYPCYSDLKKEDDNYVLNFEYTTHKQLQVNAMEMKPTFDFVIVPKIECSEISPETQIYIRVFEHQYDFDINLYH